MRLVFLFFIATIAYVFWHLWRITPGGWWLKLAAGLLFLRRPIEKEGVRK